MEYTMTATCIQDILGLYNFHAYTILSVHLLDNGVQLIRMRNPWGSEGYSGPYSDGSDEWTDADKEKVDYVDADDGMFYMIFDDFLEAFPEYQVNMFDKDKKTVRRAGRVNDDGVYFEMKNPESQELQIVVDIPFPYLTPAGCDVYNQDNQLLIALIDSNYNYLAYEWVTPWTATGVVEYTLDAGDYLVAVIDYGTHKVNDKFTITAFSDTKVELLATDLA